MFIRFVEYGGPANRFCFDGQSKKKINTFHTRGYVLYNTGNILARMVGGTYYLYRLIDKLHRAPADFMKMINTLAARKMYNDLIIPTRVFFFFYLTTINCNIRYV